MKSTPGLVLLALSLSSAELAHSAESSETGEKADQKAAGKSADKDETFGHRFQFGLRAGLVGGYLMDFRYDKSPLCRAYDFSKSASDQQKFCGRVAPLAIDLGLSFALLDFFEPFVWARFGLAADSASDTKPLMMYGLGARLYTMSDSAFKVFLEPAVAWEIEGGRGTLGWQYTGAEYKKDAVFHLAAGPQFDLAKNFGLYVDAGLTTGILRSIHTTLELQGGLQLRAP